MLTCVHRVYSVQEIESLGKKNGKMPGISQKKYPGKFRYLTKKSILLSYFWIPGIIFFYIWNKRVKIRELTNICSGKTGKYPGPLKWKIARYPGTPYQPLRTRTWTPFFLVGVGGDEDVNLWTLFQPLHTRYWTLPIFFPHHKSSLKTNFQK